MSVNEQSKNPHAAMQCLLKRYSAYCQNPIVKKDLNMINKKMYEKSFYKPLHSTMTAVAYSKYTKQQTGIFLKYTIPTVLSAKSDNDVMFCLQSY